MTTHTEQPEAMRLADRLDSNIVTGHDWPNTNDELLRVQCATELRRLHAENEALRSTLASSCDEERQQLWEATSGGGCSRALDAEAAREADREAMRMALEALEDMNNGWKYIRSMHGDLYGVGWDRAQDKADAAIKALEQRVGEL